MTEKFLSPLSYLNRDYLTENIFSIVECDPLLPLNFLLNLTDKDKLKQLSRILDELIENKDSRLEKLRNPELLENETVRDFEIRMLFEFVEKYPEHKDLIKKEYQK